MLKYLVAALGAALLLTGYFYADAARELAVTKTALSTAVQVNAADREVISGLQRRINDTDKLLADWNADRNALTEARRAASQTIKETIAHDETFKAWATSPAPADAWRLLRADPAAGDPHANHSAVSAGRVAGALPGNADPGKRH